MKKILYIFDKDGTLVGSIGNRPANTPGEQVVLPGVRERINQLRSDGHTVAIATNQGGVAWGFISLSQAYRLAWDAAQKIGGADDVAVCPYDPRAKGERARQQYAKPSPRRKPNPGMIIDLMRRQGVEPSQTVYVGDRNSDRLAAEAAGVKFVPAAEFFGEEK